VQSSCTGFELFSLQKWQSGSGVIRSVKCSTPSLRGCNRMSGTAAHVFAKSGMFPSFVCQSLLFLLPPGALFSGSEEQDDVRRRCRLRGLADADRRKLIAAAPAAIATRLLLLLVVPPPPPPVVAVRGTMLVEPDMAAYAATTKTLFAALVAIGVKSFGKIKIGIDLIAIDVSLSLMVTRRRLSPLPLSRDAFSLSLSLSLSPSGLFLSHSDRPRGVSGAHSAREREVRRK
jgi:hypothetical protein